MPLRKGILVLLLATLPGCLNAQAPRVPLKTLLLMNNARAASRSGNASEATRLLAQVRTFEPSAKAGNWTAPQMAPPSAQPLDERSDAELEAILLTSPTNVEVRHILLARAIKAGDTASIQRHRSVLGQPESIPVGKLLLLGVLCLLLLIESRKLRDILRSSYHSK
ncbi:MAG TPA: hypothetical protein PLP29_04045 [Candidatus Ozemobacteraceae bacterium]|nr:hypothetical protein [Candidatus Ozemobacteraceae bacterium]